MQDAAEHATTIHGLILLVGGFAFIAATKLVPFRSSLLKGVALVTIVLATMAAFWLTTPVTPAPSAVNGTYRNACCEAISLRDGVLITPRQRVPFKLELLKFGLIGNLVAPIEVRDGRVVSAPNAPTLVLSFSEDLRAITICGPGQCGAGREHQFVRT